MKKSFSFSRLGWVVLFLCAGALVYAFFDKGLKATNQFRVSRVERGELVQRVTIAGTVVPVRKMLIAAPYSGYVKKLYVNLGGQLKNGDPIVSVVQSLQSIDPVFPLRSPFSGTVVQINKAEGEYVKEGDSKDFIVRVDDLTTLFVKANAPEIDLVKIIQGQEAVVRASAILNRSYRGIIREVSLAATESEGWRRSQVEFPVKIELVDVDPSIKSGMSAVVDVITSKTPDVLTLGHEYIERVEDQYFVTLKDGARRSIEVGVQNEQVIEIKKGLSEGEEVRQVDFLKVFEDA